MHNSPFSVAGMQPGYLMGSISEQNAQHDVPIVQTKAKMNQILVRGKASEFGMDSMFESSRKRQTLADEDAPPMTSVVEIPNETYVEPSSGAFQPRASTLGATSLFKRPQSITASAASTSAAQNSHQQNSNQQLLYIIVFGYPSDRYSMTVEYFKSLGEATEPELNNEIINCFRIGYHDRGDAMRAVRKNGEVLCGCYMVGVKWADPALAEALFGPMSLFRSVNNPTDMSLQYPVSPSASGETSTAAQQSQHGAASPGINTPSVGTPIRLAPSAAAFRRTTASTPTQTGVSPARSWVPSVPSGMASGSGNRGNVSPSAPWPGAAGVSGGGTGDANKELQSRGVLSQVSDLIFGW